MPDIIAKTFTKENTPGEIFCKQCVSLGLRVLYSAEAGRMKFRGKAE